MALFPAVHLIKSQDIHLKSTTTNRSHLTRNSLYHRKCAETRQRHSMDKECPMDIYIQVIPLSCVLRKIKKTNYAFALLPVCWETFAHSYG